MERKPQAASMERYPPTSPLRHAQDRLSRQGRGKRESGGSGGVMSWRVASKMFWICSSCASRGSSSSTSLKASSLCVAIISRSRTNTRMMAMLTSIARARSLIQQDVLQAQGIIRIWLRGYRTTLSERCFRIDWGYLV